MIRKTSILFLLLTVFLNTSCSREPEVLRLGTMPTYSASIYMVGIDKGFFEEAGVEVSLTVFRSARDRDAAATAGELDGFMTDIMGAVNLNAKGFPYIMTSREYDDFGILTATEESGKEVTVGMAENTVTEFIVDTYMTEDIEKVNIISVPDRMGALLGGTVDYGVFPQPFMGIIQGSGGHAVRTTAAEGLYPVVMVFDQGYLKDQKSSVEAFYEGYLKTVLYMQNTDYEDYKQSLVNQGLATADTVEFYRIPVESFGLNEVDRDSYEQIMEWMIARDLLDSPIDFDEIVMTDLVK